MLATIMKQSSALAAGFNNISLLPSMARGMSTSSFTNTYAPATFGRMESSMAKECDDLEMKCKCHHGHKKPAAQIQKPAPEFEAMAFMPDGTFKPFSLAEQKGKYFVLVFYPMDFTFVCPTEIIAFSEAAEDFRKLGAEVAVISTDSHFTHMAWSNTPRKEGGVGSLSIPMIADNNHDIAKKYGVYLLEAGVALRGLFIIDDKGILRQITVNDLPVGRDVAETKRLLQAFQFTDKYGEVCPAGWHPGDDTINPEDKEAYFSKH
ncbi:hypothetical protein J8273_3821 [Carpediemonas membranifera]|uniref:thioredoxin-dependent peroxiredoxin n=1 Tax=Carpediemonas membranifera TaxID=201153 RepID=A0A8J6E2P1_9EUKA|nr:hypothetical protein J8273_3821 [Carpediemonas membranifera]|eukprot:KAG9394571.1 hypothetical protein J8273_3821 [Carpediemonas membranifera]